MAYGDHIPSTVRIAGDRRVVLGARGGVVAVVEVNHGRDVPIVELVVAVFDALAAFISSNTSSHSADMQLGLLPPSDISLLAAAELVQPRDDESVTTFVSTAVFLAADEWLTLRRAEDEVWEAVLGAELTIDAYPVDQAKCAALHATWGTLSDLRPQCLTIVQLSS